MTNTNLELVSRLSTKTMTLEDLYLKSKEIANAAEDVRIKNLSYSNISEAAPFGKLTFLDDQYNTYTANLSRWAFQQLCTKTHMPLRYANYLKTAENPEVKALFEQNFNVLLRNNNTPASSTLVRMIKETNDEGNENRFIRALLSPSYTILDTDFILKNVLNTIRNNDIDLVVKGWNIDYEGMNLRLTTSEPMDISGEDLYPGLVISTGDCGNRTLDVSFLIYKQVCTNGLILKQFEGTMLHKRHAGVFREDLEVTLKEAVSCFPELALKAKELVTATSKRKINEEEFGKLLNSLQLVTGKLTDDDKKEIKEEMNSTYGFTAWGYINALTRFAQKEKYDIDKRSDIEVHAASLLTKLAK